jgi:hypothetical protein
MRRLAALVLLVLLVLPGAALVAPVPASVAATCPAGATVDVATTVALGGSLRVTGTGWCHPDGEGSRIGIKLDEGGLSRVDGAVHANRTIWAIVDADADGRFSVDVTMPDGTTATSDPALATGPHTLRLLSGSLRAGDTVRSALSATFDVVGSGTSGPPSWAHTTVTAGGATAWVERTVAAGDGGKVRLRGTGWTGAGGASTVAVKLGSSPDGGQYRRTGSGIITHPSAAGDDTVWALLAPGGGSHPHVREIAVDGSFDVTLDLPDGLVAGQYLTLSLASGRFATGDAQRSVTTDPLVVGGVAWSGDGGGSDVACVPTSTTPTVRLASTSASFGGTLRITGAGWCNPAGGGSRIGVKIDDGAISHLDSSVHTNRTIWAVVEARDTDGTFTADLRLPDGTTATSTPALARGAHTLRLLSGSLVAGDTIRTVESAAFVVGRYRPNGIPDPLATGDLRAGTRDGVEAHRVDGRLAVRVPAASVGDWVFLSAYAADGSPRYPWDDRWFRAGRGGRLVVPAGNEPTGRVSLVAQSGAPESFGALLGWAPVRYPDATTKEPTEEPTEEPAEEPDPMPEAAAVPAAPASPAPVAAVAAVAAAPIVPLPAALVAPAAPAPSYVALGLLPAHGATAELAGPLLTLRLPEAEPGTTVSLQVYGVATSPAGLATLDADAAALVDVGALAPGDYRVSAQATDGALLGWADATIPEPEPAPATTAPAVTATTTPVSADTSSWFGATDGWLLLVGAGLLAGVLVGQRTRPRRSA